MSSPRKPAAAESPRSDRPKKSNPVDIVRNCDSPSSPSSPRTRHRSGSKTDVFDVQIYSSPRNSQVLFSSTFDAPFSLRDPYIKSYANRLRVLIVSKSDYEIFLKTYYGYPTVDEKVLLNDLINFFEQKIENVVWTLSLAKGNEELSHTLETLKKYPLEEKDFLDVFPMFETYKQSQNDLSEKISSP